MLVWLVKDGEHLPVQQDVRPMRTWMTASGLRDRGHSVVWWSSTFSHQRKALLADSDTNVEVEPRFRLRMIHAGAYRRNLSLARIRHHRVLAQLFREQALRSPKPDAIICALPTLQLVAAAVSVARERGIPLYIDVRDLWPDAFINLAPPWLRGVARRFSRRWFRRVGHLLAKADGLIAVSPGYLNWALRLAGRARGASDAVFPLGTADPPGWSDKSGKAALDGLPVTFIFVGSFGRSYNLESICDVAARLLSEGVTDIKFSLVGAGDQFDRICKRAETLTNVELHGWVGQKRLTQLLADADVGLVPCISVPDTMNNKIYEYLSMGLPQLCSLAGDAERLIEDCDIGIYYPDNEPEKLYQGVTRLAHDPALRRRQGENARRVFETQFRAQDVYARYALHLEQTVLVKPHA